MLYLSHISEETVQPVDTMQVFEITPGVVDPLEFLSCGNPKDSRGERGWPFHLNDVNRNLVDDEDLDVPDYGSFWTPQERVRHVLAFDRLIYLFSAWGA